MEEEKYEDVCKRYIVDKYEEEGVIPKEIYERYQGMEREEIEEIIHKKCYEEQILYKIEKPQEIEERNRTECLYQSKQEIYEMEELPEGITDGDVEKGYENVPELVSFQIPGIRELAQVSVQLWKPIEIELIEEIVEQVEGMKIKDLKNFSVIRGYFLSEYVNVIVIPEYQWRRKKDPEEGQENEIERRRIELNELGILLDVIGQRLEEVKGSYRNKCRYMIVDEMTWQQIQILDRRIKFKRGHSDKCFLPIREVEGIILEKSNQITILGSVLTRNGSDLIQQIKRQMANKPRMNMFGIRDFKTPLIRKKTIWRQKAKQPKKRFEPMRYNRAISTHILKWLRYETDKKNFKQIHPSLLYNDIAAKTDNFNTKYRKEVINKILDELDKINK